ncbi:MAG: hypothetical protein KGJ07_08780, partial [Patescibacteria group bacterium]|nr:hypothetical protein [Patescibacteria group bacterium]
MAQKRSADTTITSWSYKKPCLVTSEIDECLRPDADICKTMVLNAHKKAGQECHDHGAYLKVRVPGTENYVAFFFDFELRKEFNSKNFDEVCSTYGVVDIIWANTWKNIKELPKSYYLKCK